ncbi:hypothetical protein EGH21_12605 [Halomicroarcula sp. F13]|uniref:Uncharacterized protein n=1 Tax=Haloarcula rubra TaxID=2487747 RepID=A0AAW4PRP5_9EURY|nr:hypothetical protein [Halomicroarcula rubra]MBX0323871.1 hypothetical protein [Halomicroarcula rubra]
MSDAQDSSYTPALVTLKTNVRDRADELRAGLRSEDRVLEWLQEMTVRTLGRLDRRMYADMARQFRGQQGLLLGAMLRPSARRGPMRDLDEAVAKDVRERILVTHVQPAHRNAFRKLRNDVTEYVESADEGDTHDPRQQKHIGMRPGLTELDQLQQSVLAELLEGLDDKPAVIGWSSDVLDATHGELGAEWGKRVYQEGATVDVLTGDRPEHERSRRLFAATHLLPKFRAGVRVRIGRAGELPEKGAGNDTEQPDW